MAQGLLWEELSAPFWFCMGEAGESGNTALTCVLLSHCSLRARGLFENPLGMSRKSGPFGSAR